MGLSPYDKKRYKESKRRRRQALLQSETGYIKPYRRSKKPLIIGISVFAAVCAIAAAVLLLSGVFRSKPADAVPEAAMSNEERLIVVNRANRLEQDYKPNLSECGGVQVRTEIAAELQAFLNAAKQQGITLTPTQGYVSFEEQQKLYDANLEQFLKNPDYTPVRAQAAAQMVVPQAGCSEAQTGLLVAFDLSDSHIKSFVERECINYGFILRFPEGKEDATHMQPNANVYRYVGKEDAGKMRSFDMCMEEYSEYLGNQKS